MGSCRIAHAGQTWRLRRCRFYGVKIAEQRLATRLSCHSHEGDKIIGRCAGNTTFCHATVAVAVENASVVVDGDFVEIEQIAVLMTATLLPNASVTLNGIVWRSVDRHPRLSLIVSRGNKRIPFPLKTVGLVVTWLIGANETTSSPSSTPADCLGVHRVFDSVRC